MLMTLTSTIEWDGKWTGAKGIWATWVAAAIVLFSSLLKAIFHTLKRWVHGRKESILSMPSGGGSNGLYEDQPSTEITEDDLKQLMEDLDGRHRSNPGQWEDVVKKKNDVVSYAAKRRDPEDGGPTEYMSVTVFEDCSSDLLRDFYMDNDYRQEWDKTVIRHDQLSICLKTGTEVGRTIKKFPLMTAREYVLRWRVWEGTENSFYCIIKACEHPLAPRHPKYKRVDVYSSGWRISKVEGRNAAEVVMLHQEDQGEMAKIAFSRGIWGYINKMEANLQRYKSRKCEEDALNAVSLRHKVPSCLEQTSQKCSMTDMADSPASSSAHSKTKFNLFKWFTQSIFLVGWAMVFSQQGTSSLGSKLAAAIILKKAVKLRRSFKVIHRL